MSASNMLMPRMARTTPTCTHERGSSHSEDLLFQVPITACTKGTYALAVIAGTTQVKSVEMRQKKQLTHLNQSPHADVRPSELGTTDSMLC